MKRLALILLTLAGCWPAAAQSWDTSGNGMLNGTYYFRQVAWLGQNDAANDLTEAIAVYGNITFDGNGGYTITSASNARMFDSGGSGQPTTFTATGKYSVAASGYGFMDSLIVSGDSVQVLVAKSGILVGSSTDNGTGYNDLFVAAPLASSPPTNSTFSGTYSMVGMDDPTLGVADTRSYSFQLTANGNGSIASFKATGYVAGKTSAITQNFSGDTYTFTNGAASATFGGELNSGNVDADLFAGQKYLYFSPDGNFVFGGSPHGWDFILGVRQSSGSVNFNGLYYIAGLSQDDAHTSSGYVNLNSGYGSLNALTGGLILAHQRDLAVSPSNGGPFDFTYADVATTGSNGSFSDSFNQYFFGPGGAVGIGLATGNSLGIEVLVQQPAFSGNGPYIFPTGIVNAGSSVPFTASLVPGELVSIYGTNLTSSTATDGKLPTSLGDVKAVMVNNRQAPIYSVAHTSSYDQINAVIPLGTTESIASVQVITANNGSSNTVSNYMALTQPGIFNSLTTPAVQHSDYSMVTASHPAQVGETLLVYLTGLGQVDSSGKTTNTITAFMDNISAPVSFAGTQSTVGGGYQVNVQVPSGVTSGNVYLDIEGPDSYNSVAVIPVGTGTSSVRTPVTPHARPLKKSPAPKSHRNRPNSSATNAFNLR
jgi:uncharacterized protein (TIGR03437 family)